MSEEKLVLREERADGRVDLTLNRPTQFNSLSEALIDELRAELASIAGNPKNRVVVISGAGKAFCAGHDLKEMRSNLRKDYMQALFKKCGDLMMEINRLPQPVIARIHGIATAAGCQLVSMCDLAVAAQGARFAVSGINVGLFCATPAVGLSRNMGRKQALEMLLTGDFIDAAEALRRGLVNRVTAAETLDDEVEKLVQSIIAKSPVAVRMGKALYYRQLEMGMEAAYQLAVETMACNMIDGDAVEGIDAFIEKRKPEWTMV